MSMVLYNYVIVNDIKLDQSFKEVSISDFYDTENTAPEQKNEGIIILTQKEEKLYSELLPLIKEQAPAKAEKKAEEAPAKVILRFSCLQKQL